MLTDVERGQHPDILTLEGSFGMTKGIDGVPYLDIAAVVSGAGGNCDTIIESNEGAGALNQHVDPDLKVRAVADAVATAAELDMATVTTNIDTVVAAAAAGTAGNAWTINVIDGAAAKAGLAFEDTVNKVFTAILQIGTSDVADFETLITASANLAVKTGGTGATVTAAADVSYASPLAGGIDQEWVATETNNWVTIHFEPAATTVTNLETAIAAYAAAGGRIKVQTGGTGVSVLNADDAFDYMILEDGYAVDIDEGHGSTGVESIMRTAVGTYVLTLDFAVASRLGCRASLQLATADDQLVQVGPWVTATKKQTLFIWDVSDGALADIAYNASNKIHWSLSVQRQI